MKIAGYPCVVTWAETSFLRPLLVSRNGKFIGNGKFFRVGCDFPCIRSRRMEVMEKEMSENSDSEDESRRRKPTRRSARNTVGFETD